MSTVSHFKMPNGTVIDVKDTTYSVVSKTANGLCPKLPNETTTTKYLRQDGTWVQPPNTTSGTTYTAGNVPANKTFGTNGSIKNAYDALSNSKAPKSEAIKSITRSGTTFTATRCDNTTFTFTQQDNNTTTGTTYNAGSVPANTTFGTNGSIKNCYDTLKNRIDGVGQAISTNFYSGSINANGYCPNTLTLPAGKWLITTSGYAYGAITDTPVPFGLGINTGVEVKGFQPTWYVNLSTETTIYLWNFNTQAINTISLCITANRIGV